MYNQFQSSKPRTFFICLVVALISFVLGWQAVSYGFIGPEMVKENGSSKISDTNSYQEDTDLELFWTVWAQLSEKYVDHDALDDQNMVYGAIKGMVQSINDPFTVFMTPDESEQFSVSLEGHLEGIGAELTIQDKSIVILSPLKGSPAEKSGLKTGDIIYKIEDAYANDMTIVDAIMKIRGEKGTTVKLTIIREGLDKPFDVSIVRDSIDIDSVSMEEIDGIVYLSVNQFNEKTSVEFGKFVSQMLIDEPKGLIVDLRSNGGGYLSSAVDLLSYILPADTTAVIIKQRGKEDETLKTNGGTKLVNIPLVVLINDGSASASEIFAGAVQDHERGIVMGTQSFGKGSVQEVLPFTDGSSIRMTIAKWFTPDDRTIDKVGLSPDVIVELSDEDLTNDYDRQKEEAIKYLENL